jgi:hypothetical protein
MNTPTRKTGTAPQSESKMQPALPTGHKGRKDLLISAEDIRLCAYRKWESAGKPSGDGVQFWLEAEHELIRG